MKIVSLNKLASGSPFPGWKGKFFRSANMSFIYWDVSAGTELPIHTHIHEQVAHIVEGEFEIVVDGVIQILKPGGVMIIPSNAVHSGKAITDCRILDVFYPIREDYIEFEQEVN